MNESTAEAPALLSLASLYYEPLWIFVRGTPPTYLHDLEGKSIAVGTDGSGTRAVAERLLKDNGLTQPKATWVAAGGLQRGRLLCGLRQRRV